MPRRQLNEGEHEMSALTTQVGGSHYKGLAIQPVEYIHANKLGFCEGSVVKYVSRWREKGGIADLQKAKHFLELLIELEGKESAVAPTTEERRHLNTPGNEILRQNLMIIPCVELGTRPPDNDAFEEPVTIPEHGSQFQVFAERVGAPVNGRSLREAESGTLQFRPLEEVP
jgi:hypothetical protein